MDSTGTRPCSANAIRVMGGMYPATSPGPSSSGFGALILTRPLRRRIPREARRQDLQRGRAAGPAEQRRQVRARREPEGRRVGVHRRRDRRQGGRGRRVDRVRQEAAEPVSRHLAAGRRHRVREVLREVHRSRHRHVQGRCHGQRRLEQTDQVKTALPIFLYAPRPGYPAWSGRPTASGSPSFRMCSPSATATWLATRLATPRC